MVIRITEPTLYPYIKEVFEEHDAEALTTIKIVTLPDFIVNWLGERWLISIKIGDIKKSEFLKKTFIQYINEMKDFNVKYGMIIFYPEEIREIEPTDDTVRNTIRRKEAYFIVLDPQMELRKPLPDALSEIENALRRKIPTSLNLETVTTLLRAQIEDLMKGIAPSENYILKVIVDPKLFFGINPVEMNEKKKREILLKVSSFLSAYIFLSQTLFFRLYCEKRPTFLADVDLYRVTRSKARELFNKIKQINYGPIFDIDVLKFVPENLIRDTFKLMFNLRLENIRYELPGRLFHELMPKDIRKLLAAFYTRPTAAYLLAQLTIDDANATVFDPACGSGTILTMAYRRKLELWRNERRLENPHKIFCEQQIYGCDIMPFAVHLTNANLVAMDPLTAIDLTQIALEDSLKLAPSISVQPGFITLVNFLPMETKVEANAFRRTGEITKIFLKPVDVILMNPPFTKVERGVKQYIKTDKFEQTAGKEIGLWGHFIILADVFLKDDGVFGSVLPINLLRGRESEKVREIIFRRWLPLYIIKASRNYGFSEYAEYRDILVIAKKAKKKPNEHRVKFCIIKKDLNELTDDDIKRIAEQIKRVEKLRDKILDIDSYSLHYVAVHFKNMMPLICGPSLDYRESLCRITEEAEKLFCPFPINYFAEGYGPRPKGSSSFMFITRPGEGRIKEAFLILDEEREDYIIAKTPTAIQKFMFSRKYFLPSLRTPVGLSKIDVTDAYDYVAKEPYENIDKVKELSSFKEYLPEDYWMNYITKEFDRSKSRIMIARRINPYSPDQKLIAFSSQKELVVSDLFHAIKELNKERAKAIVVLLNSIFFLAYFFTRKEETTGRYIDIRQHDLYEMRLSPNAEQIKHLAEIYEKYKNEEFPSLREQLDTCFDSRYKWFWKKEREKQDILLPLPTIKPTQLRLEFDMDIINAVGAKLSKDDILKAYEAIVWDMIVTRGLRKD
jgi:hypothetical protein